jgi:predicted nucleic acid-binding protein
LVVIDTSVLAKWFIEEENSEQALRLRAAQMAGRVRGACPDFALVELGNVLRYRFSAQDVERVSASVRSIMSLGIKVVASSPEIVSEGVRVAYAHNLAVYDAIFVALAQDLGYPLVTADAELLRRTQSLGFVHHIRDWKIPGDGP